MTGISQALRKCPGWRSLLWPTAPGSPDGGSRDQFNIPQVYDDWRELLEDDSIDAVCIGTWPYMHRTLTLAALEKDKHVLCEARMASSAQEARDMLNASKAKPNLIAQIVPSPLTFKVDNLLQQLVADGYLGDLLVVEIQALGPDFVEPNSLLHWRHDRDLSGYNILTMGIWYEAMIRWVGRASKVMAMTQVNVSHRQDESGKRVDVTIPDHVDVICQLANGAQAHLRFSAVTGLSPGNEAWLYGTEGTLHLDQRLNLSGGRRGDQQLSGDIQPGSPAVRLAGGGGVHRRHPGPGTGHPHPLRCGSTLHGVDRSGDPQRPDRPGHRAAVVNLFIKIAILADILPPGHTFAGGLPLPLCGL